MSSGAGIFFDGKTSARQPVTVDAAPAALRILSPEGVPVAEWPYTELQSLAAPENVLRLGRRGSRLLERLEIRDSGLAAMIDQLAHTIDRSGAG